MNKLIVTSLIATALVLNACGDKDEKPAAEPTEVVEQTEAPAPEPTQAANPLDEAKSALAKVAAQAKVKAAQMAASAQVEAEKLAAAATKKAAKVSEVAAEAIATLSAPDAYKKCKGCHGADGQTKALGKSAIIAGQDKATLIASMNAYKAGTKNETGMGGLMKGQVASLSDQQIDEIATYLSSIEVK